MKYVCSVCGYIYDEEREGAAFASLPDSWVCPLCSAPKSAFNPQEPAAKPARPAAKPAEVPPMPADPDSRELGAGELAALFSNLARGCEKQYKLPEAQLFGEIAGYFESVTPDADPASLQDLADLILKNLNEDYPAVEAAAAAAGDRGALRACTWGTKVTRMQQAIVSRYLREGEEFLAHTNIWVCTVCGFLYVGPTPPAQCPVCKVPDWKFEKITGGVSA